MTDSGSTAWTSRREFLATSAAGLVSACVLRPAALQGADKSGIELDFTVVSDTHVGYRDSESAAKQWDRTAQEIAKQPGDFVLHLGDIVDGRREPQYAVYLKSREHIACPVYEIPGNHDPDEMFQKHVRKEIELSFDRGGVRFLLLGNAHVDSHDGFLTAAQLKWLREQCDEAASRKLTAIVAMHVPAHKNQHPDRGWYVKPENGQAELYELLDVHKSTVAALFHGHFHNGVRGWNDREPVHEICFPSALYNQSRRLAEQNAPGYNVDEFRPGYTRVSIKDGRMLLQYKPLGVEETADHVCPLAKQT